MKNLLLPAVVVCLLCSCGSSSSNDRFTKVPYTPAPAAAQQAAPAPGPAKLVSDTTPPQTVKTSQPAPNITIQNSSKDLVVQPVQTVQVAPPPAAATAKGMNPAHGQPGHRCDIAVGAPLNSPPNATAAPVVQQVTTPAQPVATNVTPQVKTAPGMNPPHGQPGHRCDISVGAPLNSKPAVTPTPAQVTPVVPSMENLPVIKKDSK